MSILLAGIWCLFVFFCVFPYWHAFVVCWLAGWLAGWHVFVSLVRLLFLQTVYLRPNISSRKDADPPEFSAQPSGEHNIRIQGMGKKKFLKEGGGSFFFSASFLPNRPGGSWLHAELKNFFVPFIPFFVLLFFAFPFHYLILYLSPYRKYFFFLIFLVSSALICFPLLLPCACMVMRGDPACAAPARRLQIRWVCLQWANAHSIVSGWANLN